MDWCEVMVVKKIFIFLVLICFATPLAAMDKSRSDSSLRHRVSAVPEMAKKPASCPSSVDASWQFKQESLIPVPQKMVDDESGKNDYRNGLGISWKWQNEETFQAARQKALDEQFVSNQRISKIRGSAKRPDNDQRKSPLSECYGILSRLFNIVSDER